MYFLRFFLLLIHIHSLPKRDSCFDKIQEDQNVCLTSRSILRRYVKRMNDYKTNGIKKWIELSLNFVCFYRICSCIENVKCVLSHLNLHTVHMFPFFPFIISWEFFSVDSSKLYLRWLCSVSKRHCENKRKKKNMFHQRIFKPLNSIMQKKAIKPY